MSSGREGNWDQAFVWGSNALSPRLSLRPVALLWLCSATPLRLTDPDGEPHALALQDPRLHVALSAAGASSAAHTSSTSATRAPFGLLALLALTPWQVYASNVTVLSIAEQRALQHWLLRATQIPKKARVLQPTDFASFKVLAVWRLPAPTRPSPADTQSYSGVRVFFKLTASQVAELADVRIAEGEQVVSLRQKVRQAFEDVELPFSGLPQLAANVAPSHAEQLVSHAWQEYTWPRKAFLGAEHAAVLWRMMLCALHRKMPRAVDEDGELPAEDHGWDADHVHGPEDMTEDQDQLPEAPAAPRQTTAFVAAEVLRKIVQLESTAEAMSLADLQRTQAVLRALDIEDAEMQALCLQSSARAYNIGKLIKTMLLARHLKAGGSLLSVIRLAAETALPTAIAAQLLEHWEQDSQVPSPATLSRAQLTLHAGWLLYEAAKRNPPHADDLLWMSVDSSPQGGRDWLMVSVELIQGPALASCFRLALCVARRQLPGSLASSDGEQHWSDDLPDDPVRVVIDGLHDDASCPTQIDTKAPLHLPPACSLKRPRVPRYLALDTLTFLSNLWLLAPGAPRYLVVWESTTSVVR